MKNDEYCLVMASPDSAEKLLTQDKEFAKVLCVCLFAPAGTALLVRQEDWNKMVDNAEYFVHEDAVLPEIKTPDAIPCAYILEKAEETTGAESTYLRKLLNDWEKEHGQD